MQFTVSVTPAIFHYFFFDVFFSLKVYKHLSAVVMGGWAVLDLSSILFINSELHCTSFAPLCNSEILFNKISENRILRSSN